MREITDAERTAAEKLLGQHRRYEDTDTDEHGHRYLFEACEWDDEDWPCAISVVAEGFLELAAASQGAMSQDGA